MTKGPVPFTIVALSVAFWLHQPDRSRGDVISYLRFEEGSGFTAADQTGLMNGDMIQFSFPLEGWSTDVPLSLIPETGQQNNYSVRFGGGSEFVDMSNANDVNLGTTFTVEYFFKAEEPFIGSLFFGLTGGSSLSATISAPQPDILFGLSFQGTLDIITASNVAYNTWQHFALVKEPGGYQVYIDGLLIADEILPSVTDGPYSFAGTALTGDRTIGGDDGTFRGWIDEFRISDTALAPDQFLIVPEPAAVSLLALGGLAVLSIRSYRRRNGMNSSR